MGGQTFHLTRQGPRRSSLGVFSKDLVVYALTLSTFVVVIRSVRWRRFTVNRTVSGSSQPAGALLNHRSVAIKILNRVYRLDRQLGHEVKFGDVEIGFQFQINQS